MLKTKQTFIMLSLVFTMPIYLLGENNQLKTSNSNKQVNKKHTTINNNVLDNQDIIKNMNNKLDKLIKSQSKNGKKVVKINKAKNLTVNQIDKSIHKTYISNKYFGKRTQCSTNCGVAIKGWKNAKRYCSIRNGLLPSKNQIKNNSKYDKQACVDCTYWTRTEAMRYNKIKKKKVHYNPKEVLVYVPSEEEFFQYETALTYIATCVSK
jgi:low affinity Fe/Cu permease